MMSLLNLYLTDPLTQNRLKSLPKNWMDTEKVIRSMNERLMRLENAVGDPSVLCLRDLAFAVHPEFRFAAALALTIDFDKRINSWLTKMWILFTESPSDKKDQILLTLQQKTLPEIGGEGYNLEASVRNSWRINPKLLWNWCNDKSLTFEMILKKIGSNINLGTEGVPQKFSRQGTDILNHLKQKAQIEKKDIY